MKKFYIPAALTCLFVLACLFATWYDTSQNELLKYASFGCFLGCLVTFFFYQVADGIYRYYHPHRHKRKHRK